MGNARKNTNSWGGPWTEQKLDAFEKYVGAYLTIMNKYRNKFGWKLIYFDGFAGCGCRKDSDSSNEEQISNLFDKELVEELCIYKGAAERILSIEQQGFDYYYFIDKSQVYIEELKARLSQYDIENKKFQFRAQDANHQLLELAKAMHKNPSMKSLVLLDPFGMQIDWSSIGQLSGTSCDLWILIPTGVIINRLLFKNGELTYIEKLKSFFGMTETEIRNEFYRKSSDNTLFGIEEKTQKISGPINRITKLYIKKLKTIFGHVTEEPLVLLNTKNVPIYHFAFASNNPTAVNIASQIIGKI